MGKIILGEDALSQFGFKRLLDSDKQPFYCLEIGETEIIVQNEEIYFLSVAELIDRIVKTAYRRGGESGETSLQNELKKLLGIKDQN